MLFSVYTMKVTPDHSCATTVISTLSCFIHYPCICIIPISALSRHNDEPLQKNAQLTAVQVYLPQSALWLWEQQVTTFTLLYKQAGPALPPTLFSFHSHFCRGIEWVPTLLIHLLSSFKIDACCFTVYEKKPKDDLNVWEIWGDLLCFNVRSGLKQHICTVNITNTSAGGVGKSWTMSHPSGWKEGSFKCFFSSTFTDPRTMNKLLVITVLVALFALSKFVLRE